MLTVGGLFDGCGLLAYGLHRAGLRHAWLCEVDPFRRSLLELRFPGVPVVSDVRLVGDDTVPRVDVIAGGFPCKGASTAGKRTGFEHPETVLWREMARAVRELRPRYVFVENVANILAIHDGALWGEVVGDLAALGFGVRWDCLPAAAFGAPHLRDRVFAIAVADAPDLGPERHRQTWERGPGPADGGQPAADAERVRQPGGTPLRERRPEAQWGGSADRQPVSWGRYEAAIRRWETVVGPAPEPVVPRVVDGRSAGVERSRLSALGDGVLVQAAEACGRLIANHAREAAATVSTAG